jgi:hypothetical protein
MVIWPPVSEGASLMDDGGIGTIKDAQLGVPEVLAMGRTVTVLEP